MSGEQGEATPEKRLHTVTASETGTAVVEGTASIEFGSRDVFYNKVQVRNRDLTILVIKVWKDIYSRERDEVALKRGKEIVPMKLRIFEGLSATGLRSIRFAKELEDVDFVVANDIEPTAVASIQKNVALNNVTGIVRPLQSDAVLTMMQHRDMESPQFHVVDIDPYGSPSIFLDSAVQCVVDGGLLCVTATDMRYGSVPLSTKFCHEQAIRIVLYSIQTSAARYGRSVAPILCVFMDFYVRLFVRVSSSRAKARDSLRNVCYVYQCSGCESYTVQPICRALAVDDGKPEKYVPADAPMIDRKCEHCARHCKLGGPFWLSPFFDQGFVSKCAERLKTESSLYPAAPRVFSILNALLEELPDVPFFYVPSSLTSTLKTNCPSLPQWRSALKRRGYRYSISHCKGGSLKTDAPAGVLWDFLRNWVVVHPVNRNVLAGTAGGVILEKKAVEDEDVLKIESDTAGTGVPKFLMNPEPGWGPGRSAKRTGGKRKREDDDEKSNAGPDKHM